MDPKNQRIAIAKACGYSELSMPSGCPVAWKHPTNPELDVINHLYLPDYLNDLNAMHEAEKVLRKVIYPTDTDTIIGDRMHNYVELLNYEVDATAAQRAEAFLKTLNLWTN